MHLRRLARALPLLAAAVLLVLPLAVQTAPPSGGGGSKVSVTAANPPDAFQGEELDVIVSGSGFDAGSQVSYLVTGTTDASQVEVLSVQFISSSELKTRIRPRVAALPSEYDIEVQTSSGRKGKGTTLFRVKVTESTTSCTDSPSEFPAFAYIELKRSGGPILGFDMYLSNADGDCSVLLHSIQAEESEIDLNYRQIGDLGIVAWRQWGDEFASGQKGRQSGDAKYHDVIRVIRFEISGKELTTALPLTPDTVANSGNRWLGFDSIDLSADGSKIVIYHFDALSRADEDVVVQTIREMDISNCSSDCSQAVIYASTDFENFHNVSYGLTENRIYFSGGIHGAGDPRVGQGYIAFLDYQDGAWLGPRELTFEGNGYYGGDFSGSGTFRDIDVAAVDLGSGSPSEAVAYTFLNVETNKLDVHVIDAATCSVFGTGDCLSAGESDFVSSIADGRFPSFSNGPSDSKLLFSGYSSEEIFQFDLATNEVSRVASGNEADSKN